MTPLDLSERPPRPCRADVDGIIFLARSIDKARAALPGGNLAGYVLTVDGLRTLTGGMLRRFGVAPDAFVEAVAAARDEAEVAAWVRARVTPQAIEEWNVIVTSLCVGATDEATRARIRAGHPNAPDAGDDALIIDVIDAEDRAVHAEA